MQWQHVMNKIGDHAETMTKHHCHLTAAQLNSGQKAFIEKMLNLQIQTQDMSNRY